MRLMREETDTETMQPVADALLAFAQEVLTHFDQLTQVWRDLPRHWQGHAAQRARVDLRAWLNQVEESSNMGKFMGQHAQQCAELTSKTTPSSDEKKI